MSLTRDGSMRGFPPGLHIETMPPPAGQGLRCKIKRIPSFAPASPSGSPPTSSDKPGVRLFDSAIAPAEGLQYSAQREGPSRVRREGLVFSFAEVRVDPVHVFSTLLNRPGRPSYPIIPYPTGRFFRGTLFQALRARVRSVSSSGAQWHAFGDL